MNRSSLLHWLQPVCGLLLAIPALARAEETAVRATQLAEGVYVFGGMQANSVAIVGSDGVVLIDSGESVAVAQKLENALTTVTAQPVRLLVNTHWHYDHVSGNGVFAAKGAVVLGQTAMRERAATQPVRSGQPLPPAELPVVTLAGQLALHCNGDEVQLLHPRIGKAHTDGDTIVLLPKANIAVIGDLYFVGFYPYIDAAAGGSAAGMAVAIREILPQLNDDTKVVPGHGPVTNKAQLAAYAAMLDDISGKVSALLGEGKTLEQIQQAKLTAAYDAEWGRGYFKPDQFVGFVHAGLTQRQGK